MEMNVPCGPSAIALFRTNGIVAAPHDSPHFVQEFHGNNIVAGLIFLNRVYAGY
jgi:hypothetical protein